MSNSIVIGIVGKTIFIMAAETVLVFNQYLAKHSNANIGYIQFVVAATTRLATKKLRLLM